MCLCLFLFYVQPSGACGESSDVFCNGSNDGFVIFGPRHGLFYRYERKKPLDTFRLETRSLSTNWTDEYRGYEVFFEPGVSELL
jgi:hypothetical protein